MPSISRPLYHWMSGAISPRAEEKTRPCGARGRGLVLAAGACRQPLFAEHVRQLAAAGRRRRQPGGAGESAQPSHE